VNAVDDLSRRSLRELLTLARERLGRGAAELKTRGELIAALRKATGGEGVGVAVPVVAPSPATASSSAVGIAATSPGGARAGEPPTVVTSDFFIVHR
jgi:hypothetical protein